MRFATRQTFSRLVLKSELVRSFIYVFFIPPFKVKNSNIRFATRQTFSRLVFKAELVFTLKGGIKKYISDLLMMKRSHIHFNAKRDFIPLRIKSELVFTLKVGIKNIPRNKKYTSELFILK